MNRFRKWSDARSSQLPESVRSSTVSSRFSSQPSESLPALPPVGDFRTSLILPDLSRRFTFLRAASGDPVSLDDLKNRLAEQRARGAENHLSEEEAEMFLQTLSRLRSKASTSSTSIDSSHDLTRESLRSDETTSSSVTSSPASTKRYSNNMFGSGKFRDYTYMRSVSKERTAKVSAGRRSTNSALLSAGGHSFKMSDPPIPEDSPQTDPDLSHDSDTTPLASSVDASASELEQGIVKTFQPSHVRRVSMAMEEVIREIEEEADDGADGDGDDKILIPRAAAPERASSFKRISIDSPRPIPLPSEHHVYETGTAVSPDPYSQTDAAEFRSSPSPYPRAETSPVPRRPGYIPGMPRPMTPREATFDPDEYSPSSSSTPRATSPRIPDRATSPNFASGTPRRDSSIRQLHRTSSPPPSASAPIASLLSGVNGRFSPDRSRTPDGPSVEFGNPLDSSVLGRRRPVSPFSQGTYQSMTMSSRPSTPSNVTWKASTTSSSAGGSRSGSAIGFSESDFSSASGLPSPLRNGFDRPSAHKRDDSNMSSNDEFAQLNRSGSVLGNRSLRSPTLPESPGPENGSQSGSQTLATFTYPKRGQPSAPSNDLGSSSLALRSSTPTQYAPRSPGSPALFDHDVGRNSRLSSRQATASPFAPQTPILSALANSSRSSLESAGSSYHTWEADKQDRTLPILAALEPQPVAWHDLSVPGGDSSSPADGDVEEVVQQHAGLSKGDFVAIQRRLLLAAKLKAEAPEPRERRNSLRRRRPSASQTASGRDNGATDITQQGSLPRTDSLSKASALLDSVVDSIQAPRPKLPSPPTELKTDVVSGTPTDPEPSSATRRKNALARALFGASDSEQSLSSSSPQPTDGLSAEQVPQIESSLSSRSLRESLSPASPNGAPSSSATELREKEKQELAMEVQRKAEAAMAQLKKTPSTTKVNDSALKKRIDPSQISGPKLVSASTSVDTIPVRSPSAASGQLPAGQTLSPNASKLGSRFKKIRGSLRAKPTLPSGDGSTLHPFDQPSSADRSLAGTPDGPPPFSATEPTRSKVIPPPHPATAGPGLKGFVSRFLKPRSGDTSEHERRKQIPSSSSPAPPSYFAHQQAERHPEVSNPGQTTRSAPADSKSFRPHTPVSPESPPRNPPPSAPPVNPSVPHGGDTGTATDVDESALKQFIDAANNLGLDQAALTEFLNRSTSITSKRLTAQSSKHMSTESSDKIGHDKSNLTLGDPSMLAPSDRGASPRPSGEIVGKAPLRKPVPLKPDANAAVVRRTLIFPSEGKQSTLEPGTALRKSSSTRRRRSASAASMHSNRSLHDRVPTPPPPKSPTGKRFSAEQSPPLPHIPNSLLSQTEAASNVPQSPTAVPLEKSNSAYESLYEMYTGDGKPAISVTGDAQSPDTSSSNPNALHNLEPGAAVEVLELANGETIWSIVNGLRDDDEESFYGNRASFVSEYSLRDNEGVQVFFKEHGRKGSKDSQASFLSRKKPTQGSKRPETKVFFSSSAQIGRLIDNLSHGAESGSFNILPNTQTHSSRPSESSSAHWTVEERLENMLTSLGTTS